MKWEFEEELLLLELFIETMGTQSGYKQYEICQLSELLNKRAFALGYDVDDRFRNTAGINMKLQNMSFVISEGKKGLASVSKLDYDVYDFYKKTKMHFQKYVKK